ncbi:MAG: GTPase HflX, partial [Rickettsiales bacterium]
MKDIKFLKTFIIHPILDKKENIDYKLNEIIDLASAIDLHIYDTSIVNIDRINSANFIGSGKVSQYCELVKSNKIDLVIFNYKLTPIQHRNLEKSLNCKVIDRTSLIIEIFADRAKTKEGKLQIELIALQHQKSRLVRSWTHLERQRGGFGFTGGPGETQIESDRRNIRNQISKIKEELLNVKKTRSIHRKSRKKVPYPIVSLVGYSNAGKTSLFNLLSEDTQYVDDKLFATLDPVMRKVKFDSKKTIILSDTVGFISDLPTEFVEAFSSTLEEVKQADVILHIVDISNDKHKEQK